MNMGPGCGSFKLAWRKCQSSRLPCVQTSRPGCGLVRLTTHDDSSTSVVHCDWLALYRRAFPCSLTSSALSWKCLLSIMFGRGLRDLKRATMEFVKPVTKQLKSFVTLFSSTASLQGVDTLFFSLNQRWGTFIPLRKILIFKVSLAGHAKLSTLKLTTFATCTILACLALLNKTQQFRRSSSSSLDLNGCAYYNSRHQTGSGPKSSV